MARPIPDGATLINGLGVADLDQDESCVVGCCQGAMKLPRQKVSPPWRQIGTSPTHSSILPLIAMQKGGYSTTGGVNINLSINWPHPTILP